MTSPSGYVDPSIVPAGARQAEILRLIVARGLRLERRGAALVLSGPGVFIAAADLASFARIDTIAQSRGGTVGDTAPRTLPREYYAGNRKMARGNG